MFWFTNELLVSPFLSLTGDQASCILVFAFIFFYYFKSASKINDKMKRINTPFGVNSDFLFFVFLIYILSVASQFYTRVNRHEFWDTIKKVLGIELFLYDIKRDLFLWGILLDPELSLPLLVEVAEGCREEQSQTLSLRSQKQYRSLPEASRPVGKWLPVTHFNSVLLVCMTSPEAS